MSSYPEETGVRISVHNETLTVTYYQPMVVGTMKMLMISYHFPPCTDGAATLMYNLCKYLPTECYSVITVSEEFGKSPAQNSFGGYDEKYNIRCDTIRLPVKTDRMRDRVRFLLLGILKGLLLEKKAFDSILVVYPDEFDLFIAYILYLLTRKPLVVYMHDLYSEVRKNARLYRIWRFFENRLLSSASTVLVTNEKFRDYYNSKRGLKNVTVLHSCVDLDSYKKEKPIQMRQHNVDKLKIVYTGSVYGANDDAVISFLKAARKVDNLEIVFSTPSQKDYLKEVNVGFLSKKDCSELQKSADVLFLPLSFKRHLREEIVCAFPCKVLEYLAAGKPILAVVPEGSFSEALLKNSGAGLVVTELSEEKIVDAINALRDSEQRSSLSSNALKTAPFFDAHVQSERLRSIIKNVVLQASASRVENEANLKKYETSERKNMPILFIQPAYAKYRQPLFDRLSQKFDTTFYFIAEPMTYFQDKKSSKRTTNQPGEQELRLSRVIRLVRGYLHLLVCLATDNYSVAVTSISDSPQTILSLLISRMRRKKCVLMIEEWFVPRKKSTITRFRLIVKRLTMTNADAVVAIGTAQYNYVRNFGVPSRKVFMSNHCSLDFSMYKSENLKKKLNIDKGLVVLYLGRIIKNKALDILIRAFSKIEQKTNDFFLVACGDGDYRPYCENLVRKLKVGNIIFRGTVCGEENIASYYRTADVFVLPSSLRGYEKMYCEGWGLVINEAMSMGKPVITTNAVGAAPDLVKNGINGYIVKNLDPDALYSALKKVLENKNLRETMGKNSRKIFDDFNDFDKMFEGFRDAINYVTTNQGDRTRK